MSPEVTSNLEEEDGKGYGEEVDWWSLGCVFFEIVVGVPPIDGEDPYAIFDNIMHWRTILPKELEEVSDELSPMFMELLNRLLCEPEKRISRLEQFTSLEFFKNTDFNNLHKYTPPFVPNCPSVEDL